LLINYDSFSDKVLTKPAIVLLLEVNAEITFLAGD
jgi:hypothetical protein